MKFKFKETKIYWINMDRDVDRRERMEKFLDAYSIEATRVSGVEADNAIIGVNKAHLKVLEQSPDENFIILEDDCVPTEWFDMDSECEIREADGLYLGISLWARKEKTSTGSDRLEQARTIYSSVYSSAINDPWYKTSGPFLDVYPEHLPGIRKVTNMLSTHAIYYATNKMKERAISLLTETLALDTPRYIDCLFADMLQKEQNIYAMDKPLFYQTSSEAVTKFTLSTYEEDCLRHLKEVYGISV